MEETFREKSDRLFLSIENKLENINYDISDDLADKIIEELNLIIEVTYLKVKYIEQHLRSLKLVERIRGRKG